MGTLATDKNNQPPLLNQPRNNARVSSSTPQNLLFSWTPRHNTSPTGLVYELFLYEVPQGEDPAVVVNSGLPAAQVLLSAQPSLVYGPAQVPLKEGQRYAWQVRVESLDAQVAFSNNGLSDVGSFVYGRPPCPPPAQLAAVVDGQVGAVQLSWQPPQEAEPAVVGYRLSYGALPNGIATEKSLSAAAFLLMQLPSEQPYQWRVRSVCAQGQSVAVVSSFTLPPPPAAQEPAWISDPALAYEPPQDPTPSPEVLQSSQYDAPQGQQQQQNDNETQEEDQTAEAEAILDDLLNTPVKIYVPAQGQELPPGLTDPVAQLPADATTQQLQDALKKQKPTCSGLSASYVCGNHDAVPQYSGEIASVTSVPLDNLRKQKLEK